LLIISTSAAFARNSEVLIDAQEAVVKQGNGDLLDIPYYLKGHYHPPVLKKIGHWRSTRKGNGAFKSDDDACRRTFVTALKSLQERAQQEGGNAIINIVSVTKGTHYENATQIRCIAGNIIVHVAIEGDVVVLKSRKNKK
jgi:uncharacterized protein YbjQ (UPF0145 family)